MSRAFLSGWYQLPIQGLSSCHLARKSGSNGEADALVQSKTYNLHLICSWSEELLRPGCLSC